MRMEPAIMLLDGNTFHCWFSPSKVPTHYLKGVSTSLIRSFYRTPPHQTDELRIPDKSLLAIHAVSVRCFPLTDWLCVLRSDEAALAYLSTYTIAGAYTA